MDLSVIIVNWKVKDLLRQCLASVYRQQGVSFEVFVVDNDSRDGSVEMVVKEFPEATVIANNRNLGFAAANNQAIQQSQGEFVLLLNPDTDCSDGAFAKMVAWMRQNPKAAIMGPRVLNPDGTVQHSVRNLPTLWSQVLIILKLHHVFPKLQVLRDYFAADFDYTKEARVEQVIGAVFLIRRSLLEAIGTLDERYFIWFEEADFCKRAIDADYEVWYAPVADVTHRGGESFGKVFGPVKQRYFDTSLRTYFQIHEGLGGYLLLTVLHPIAMALAWLVTAAKAKRKKYDY